MSTKTRVIILCAILVLSIAMNVGHKIQEGQLLEQIESLESQLQQSNAKLLNISE